MRLDEVATVRLFAPMRRLRPRPGVPILMYHSISEEPEPGRTPYLRLNTPPALFRRQLLGLRREGYRVLELEALLGAEAEPPAGPVAVLTFDDGYSDFLRNAFPLLQEFGFPATVFLPTASLEHGRLTFNGRTCLRWEEVRWLAGQGVAFGSHSLSHRRMEGMGERELRHELEGSRRELEWRLGGEVRTFSLPYAFPSNRPAFLGLLKRLLQDSGYRCCCTTSVGRLPPRPAFYLPRLPVNGADGLPLFLAKLEGGYDWVRHPQRWAKALRGSFPCRRGSAS